LRLETQRLWIDGHKAVRSIAGARRDADSMRAARRRDPTQDIHQYPLTPAVKAHSISAKIGCGPSQTRGEAFPYATR
jgi:hypothetical protein